MSLSQSWTQIWSSRVLRLAGELEPGNEEDEEIRRRRVKVDVENFDVTKQRSVLKTLRQEIDSIQEGCFWFGTKNNEEKEDQL